MLQNAKKVHFPGILKVQEECAELLVELAKLGVCPEGGHWDEAEKGPLIPRVEDELGDVLGAVTWFLSRNSGSLNVGRVLERQQEKYARFERWDRETGMAGVVLPNVEPFVGSPASGVVSEELAQAFLDWFTAPIDEKGTPYRPMTDAELRSDVAPFPVRERRASDLDMSTSNVNERGLTWHEWAGRVGYDFDACNRVESKLYARLRAAWRAGREPSGWCEEQAARAERGGLTVERAREIVRVIDLWRKQGRELAFTEAVAAELKAAGFMGEDGMLNLYALRQMATGSGVEES